MPPPSVNDFGTTTMTPHALPAEKIGRGLPPSGGAPPNASTSELAEGAVESGAAFFGSVCVAEPGLPALAVALGCTLAALDEAAGASGSVWDAVLLPHAAVSPSAAATACTTARPTVLMRDE